MDERADLLAGHAAQDGVLLVQVVEALTHPAIGTAVEAWSAAAAGPYQILIIPLLVEKNLTSQVDRVLVVDCDEELQIRRLQARDGSTVEQARAILNVQTSRTARLKSAHDVIQNDGDLSVVRDQVSALHARYLELSGQSGTGGAATITAKAAPARFS